MHTYTQKFVLPKCAHVWKQMWISLMEKSKFLTPVWISPLEKSKLLLQIWISAMEKSVFWVTAWSSPMDTSKLVQKKRISPSGKSIYACRYTHIWVIQICVCAQADMDFSREKSKFLKPVWISLLEKSKLLQQNWISTMEKSIYVSHICKYLDYPSMNFWIYMNCHLKDSHFCRSTCTLPHYHFTICAKVEATSITRDRGISEAGWRVH